MEICSIELLPLDWEVLVLGVKHLALRCAAQNALDRGGLPRVVFLLRPGLRCTVLAADYSIYQHFLCYYNNFDFHALESIKEEGE